MRLQIGASHHIGGVFFILHYISCKKETSYDVSYSYGNRNSLQRLRCKEYNRASHDMRSLMHTDRQQKSRVVLLSVRESKLFATFTLQIGEACLAARLPPYRASREMRSLDTYGSATKKQSSKTTLLFCW